jgi:hypothetical protein
VPIWSLIGRSIYRAENTQAFLRNIVDNSGLGKAMAREGKSDEINKIKKLAEFKTLLEKKITDAEADLGNLKILLEFVNKILLEKGFKRAEIAKPGPAKASVLPPVMEYKTVIPLKAVTGELLANLYMSHESMRVTIAEDKKFNVKTPPFQQFLIERVLGKMQEKDNEAASKGEMAFNKVFSYELILDGDAIRDILIKNVTADRMRELRSSVHWTLEKMYEKAEKHA